MDCVFSLGLCLLFSCTCNIGHGEGGDHSGGIGRFLVHAVLILEWPLYLKRINIKKKKKKRLDSSILRVLYFPCD